MRTVRLIGAAALLAAGLLPSLPLNAAPRHALPPQFSALRTVAEKLAYLQNNAGSLSLSQKAELGAAIILSVPADQQKAVAGQVARILTPKGVDPVKLATQLIKALPAELAGALGGSIALGASQTDPSRLPQITAEVIAATPSTIANAPAIAAEVVAASPIDRASAIASAIGATFIDQKALAEKAPQIAASMIGALVQHGTLDQVRSQAAQTVAALTVLLPGNINDNKQQITQVGKDVAAVISAQYPSLAPDIVGMTTEALKTAAGGTNVSPVLTSFADAFSAAIGDTAIKNQITATLTSVERGTANIDIKPLEKTINDATKSAGNPSVLPGASTDSSKVPEPGSLYFFAPQPTPTPTPTPHEVPVGPVNPPETPVTPV